MSGDFVFELRNQPQDYNKYRRIMVDLGMTDELIERNNKLKYVHVEDTTDGSGRVILNFGTRSGQISCVENIRPGILFEESSLDGTSVYTSIWYRYGSTLVKQCKPSNRSEMSYSLERKFDHRKMTTTLTAGKTTATVNFTRQ
jgi:hypothetical protein